MVTTMAASNEQTLSKFNNSILDEDFFYGIFENRPSKFVCIVLAILVLSIELFLYYGIIWYERFGTDNRRTLTNELLTNLCWTIIVSIFISFLNLARYIFGPLPAYYCFFQLLLKVVSKTVILLFLDAILLTRYLMIFWLKNPSAIKDDFWGSFLGLWITGKNLNHSNQLGNLAAWTYISKKTLISCFVILIVGD
jgi:hypothetical protein